MDFLATICCYGTILGRWYGKYLLLVNFYPAQKMLQNGEMVSVSFGEKAGFIEDTEYMAFFGKSAATAAGAGGWKIGIYWQSRYNVI